MDDEEMLFKQVQMTTAATPGSSVWVYRCSVYAYPWYTSVRTILDDPAYSSWFIKFKPKGPWFSPKCDNNFSPPRCSDLYHMQEQTCVTDACNLRPPNGLKSQPYARPTTLNHQARLSARRRRLRAARLRLRHEPVRLLPVRPSIAQRLPAAPATAALTTPPQNANPTARQVEPLGDGGRQRADVSRLVRR